MRGSYLRLPILTGSWARRERPWGVMVADEKFTAGFLLMWHELDGRTFVQRLAAQRTRHRRKDKMLFFWKRASGEILSRRYRIGLIGVSSAAWL